MVSAKNPVIKKAFGELMALSADERKRMLYESRLKLWRDQQSRLQEARRKGLKGTSKNIFSTTKDTKFHENPFL